MCGHVSVDLIRGKLRQGLSAPHNEYLDARSRLGGDLKRTDCHLNRPLFVFDVGAPCLEVLEDVLTLPTDCRSNPFRVNASGVSDVESWLTVIPPSDQCPEPERTHAAGLCVALLNLRHVPGDSRHWSRLRVTQTI